MNDDELLDDLLLDLPPMGASDDDPLFSDEESLIAGIEFSSDENVGLDDEEGLEDDVDPASFLDLGSSSDETHDGGDLKSAALDLDLLEGYADGAEYGLVVDSDAPSLDEWEDDFEGTTETTSVREDDGELGVEDEFTIVGDDDDDSGLPPLARIGDEEDEEEVAADLDLALDGEVDSSGYGFEHEARLSGQSLPPGAPQQVQFLGLDAPIHSLFATEEGDAYVVAGGLYRVGAGALHELPAEGLAAGEITSVAALANVLVVGTAASGTWRSTDGGASFLPANRWRRGRSFAPCSPCFVTAQQSRLWMRVQGGALFRSDDFGESWEGPVLPSPVVAARGSHGSLVALCVTATGAMITRTEDSGRHWVGRSVPLTSRADDYFVDVAGDLLVAGAVGDPAGGQISRDDGKTFTRLDGLPRMGPARLFTRGGETVLETVVSLRPDAPGEVVIRRGPDGDALLFDARESSPRAGAVLDLAPVPGGLLVATDRGLFMVHETGEADAA